MNEDLKRRLRLKRELLAMLKACKIISTALTISLNQLLLNRNKIEELLRKVEELDKEVAK